MDRPHRALEPNTLDSASTGQAHRPAALAFTPSYAQDRRHLLFSDGKLPDGISQLSRIKRFAYHQVHRRQGISLSAKIFSAYAIVRMTGFWSQGIVKTVWLVPYLLAQHGISTYPYHHGTSGAVGCHTANLG